MRFKLKGNKYKYKPQYWKSKDDMGVKLPSYSIYRYGSMLYNGKWQDCRFYILKTSNGTEIEISATSFTKDGKSNIGEVNSFGILDRIKLPFFTKYLIKIFDSIFISKIYFLRAVDRLNLIKKNLRYIIIALIGSIIYFFINHFYDNYLQELINRSNIVQSIIVFLSLSSIINIIHPFTLRKEWSIEEIDNLIVKRIDKNKKDLEDEEWIEKQSTF